jgi:hypothetical protein
MTRALGIPVAVVVLVALPGVVVQATETEEPPAKEAALTVNLQGDQGSSDDPYLFAVTAEGTAPAAAATLKDASGLHTGVVAPASGCPTPARVAFPDQKQTWCLQMEDVDSGYELTGSATGGDEKVGSRPLKLTVNRRDAFWGKPLFFLILGLLAGALVALVKPGLRSPVRRNVLGKQLKDNQGIKGPEHIEGLTEFVGRRLGQGEAVDDLIKKVTGLRENGPAAALAARKELKEVLDGKQAVLAGYALLIAANKEAARTDTRVGDFYGADDTAKPHTASELAAAIKALAENLEYAKKLRGQIGELEEEHRKEPLQALVRAEAVAKEAATLVDANRVKGLLDEARNSIESARAKEAEEVDRQEGEGPEAPAALTGPNPQPSPNAAELGGSDLASSRRWLLAITTLTVAAILAFAFFTIKQAAYDPKLTFHSGADYFTLFSTALASAAVGTVILLVGYWFAVTPAGEE